MAIRDYVFLGICCLIPVYLGGCCCNCSGRFPPANFTVTDGSADGTELPADPDETQEMKDARDKAQQALNKTGYGDVRTVTLQKDGTNWYTTGMVDDGGRDVSYNVWFIVTINETEHEIKTIWAAKQVTVDGEIVFP